MTKAKPNPLNPDSDFFILATLAGFQPMQGDPDNYLSWRSPTDQGPWLARQQTAEAVAANIRAKLQEQHIQQTQFRIVVQMSSTLTLTGYAETPPLWRGTGPLITNCQNLLTLINTPIGR